MWIRFDGTFRFSFHSSSLFLSPSIYVSKPATETVAALKKLFLRRKWNTAFVCVDVCDCITMRRNLLLPGGFRSRRQLHHRFTTDCPGQQQQHTNMDELENKREVTATATVTAWRALASFIGCTTCSRQSLVALGRT